MNAIPAIEARAEFPLRTEGLTRRFGARAAVDSVDLRVPRGTTYGLIGLNGAGKSTLIRLLMGLLRPSAGRALVCGQDVSERRPEWRHRVGYVPDVPAVYPWMRVHQAVAFCRALQPRWNDGYCAELLGRFRLDPSQRVSRLSKGGGAKLSLLLALAHEPEVLVLDEPTDGLDPVARDDFLEGVLASVCERERTVLISSHQLDDVQRLADWIGLIHNGRLAVQSPTEDLVRSARRVRAVLREGAVAPAIPGGVLIERREGRRWLASVRGLGEETLGLLRANPGVAEVATEELTLEEIFKDFVRGQEGAA